jgi:hypothetical protein
MSKAVTILGVMSSERTRLAIGSPISSLVAQFTMYHPNFYRMKTLKPFALFLAFLAAFFTLVLPATAQNNGMWRTNGNNNAGNGQFVGTNDSSPLVFKTGGVERMRIQGNGALRLSGLAGSQPAVLAVASDGSIFRYADPAIDSSFNCSTMLYRASGNWLTPNCFIGSTNLAPFRIFTNNAERMRFTETGNVGIGTDLPMTPLHFYSTSNAELRVQGSSPATQPQIGFAMGTGQTAVKLADFRAGINTQTFIPEVFVEVNDASGQYAMKKVLRIDRDKAELMTRLGVGMVAPANDFMGVNGSLKLVETNNPANYIRMGHDGANAFIDYATTSSNSNNPSRLYINQNGGRTDFGGTVILAQNLGIGTTNFHDAGNNKDYRLSVDGRIRCNEVKVYSGWADYVFEADYELMPLPAVEAFITTNGHLPGLPSASEVAQNGVDLGASQALLLEKIEELTLHLIQLQKENAELRADVDAMK